MAEFKFSCPSCKQNIICDELWCGQQIQCPSCQAELVVPQQQASTSSSLVPPPPPGAASKLSIGRPQAAPSGAAHPAQKFVPGLRTPAVRAKPKKSGLLKIAGIGAVVILLGAGGYFGYDWWRTRQEKADAAAAAASKQAAADAAAAQGPAPEKKLPIVPPLWTLDVAAAKIPEGQANGMVAGTNFVVDTARIDRVGTAQVLALRQGASPSADRELLIYLHLNAGESIPGHTWTVSQDMKGAAVPQVLKRWKTNPNPAPQQKFFSTGYAMKLEFGQASDGAIPGKIFLALPDPEQSVVAGIFKILSASSEQTPQPVAAQTPTPEAPSGGDKAAFERRYGVKKR